MIIPGELEGAKHYNDQLATLADPSTRLHDEFCRLSGLLSGESLHLSDKDRLQASACLDTLYATIREVAVLLACGSATDAERLTERFRE